MSKIGIKPSDSTVAKGIIRIQKLVDELKRENDLLKARVLVAENNETLLKARVKKLEDA